MARPLNAVRSAEIPVLAPGRWRIYALFGACIAAFVAALILGVAVGAIAIPPVAVVELIAARLLALPRPAIYPDTFDIILFDIRLPRVAITALIGAALAASGSTYQGLFRNPLADPYLVGVASGAGLGATLAISFNLHTSPLGLNAVPVAAFVGAVATVSVVVLSAQVGRTTPVSTMLLAGVAIGAFATALTTFVMLRSPDGLRRAFNWMLGGYNGGGWGPFFVTVPYLVIGLIVLQFNSRALNILQLDEEQARQLGIHVERLKITLVTAATLITAAAVAFGGLVGFVGLVVPHMLRLLGVHDYRRLIPLSALGGAAFLIFADLIARTLLAPTELPVGVVTALAGAPFFVILLRRLKRSVF
jgi:iron complex transport system permease protein